MSIGEASSSMLDDGTRYGWTVEEAEPKGCSLTVSIANWAMSRTFEVVLSSADASAEAARMAKALIVTIQGSS